MNTTTTTTTNDDFVEETLETVETSTSDSLTYKREYFDKLTLIDYNEYMPFSVQDLISILYKYELQNLNVRFMHDKSNKRLLVVSCWWSREHFEILKSGYYDEYRYNFSDIDWV